MYVDSSYVIHLVGTDEEIHKVLEWILNETKIFFR